MEPIKSIVFFGDSLTAGSNSRRRFTHYLEDALVGNVIYNFAVSGTTIGEYSIYPVDGESLLSQIAKHKESIISATDIFIEYGSNDVSAVMCGFATVQTVTVSLVKAIDWINQLNPNARIIFLVPGSDSVIYAKSVEMCHYLEHDYFKQFDFSFPDTLYCETYKKIIQNVSIICDTMYMFDDGMLDSKYLSDDGIHPNDSGHYRIAQNILSQYNRA